MKHILLFSVFLFAFSSFTHGQNYSIKNRLNTKLSLSFNRTNERNSPIMHFDKIPIHPLMARHNMRAECNYGVLNWLELGGYIGYIRYLNGYHNYKKYLKGKFDPYHTVTFAPTFGINVNVHLLPFFVKNRDCRWEWYVTAKYGGAYLINYDSYTIDAILFGERWFIDTISHYYAEDSEKRYRHVFGIGMGGGVYFWNVFGLYAEVMVGQYSYFPKMEACYYTARAGIEFKFTPKKTKAKIAPEHREIQVE